MGKTLEQIIARKDYEHLNDALKNHSINLAVKVLRKMKELNVESLNGYQVVKIRSSISWEVYLGVELESGYEMLNSDFTGYLHGDFNCWVQAASSKERLRFLNSARKILDSLDAIETQKCQEIEKAIAETKDL